MWHKWNQEHRSQRQLFMEQEHWQELDPDLDMSSIADQDWSTCLPTPGLSQWNISKKSKSQLSYLYRWFYTTGLDLMICFNFIDDFKLETNSCPHVHSLWWFWWAFTTPLYNVFCIVFSDEWESCCVQFNPKCNLYANSSKLLWIPDLGLMYQELDVRSSSSTLGGSPRTAATQHPITHHILGNEMHGWLRLRQTEVGVSVS